MLNTVENSKDTYAIIRPVTYAYINLNNKYEKMNIIALYANNNKEFQENIQNEIKSILKNNKNAVIYTVLLNPDKNNPEANYKCFYDKKSDLCLWEIKNKSD